MMRDKRYKIGGGGQIPSKESRLCQKVLSIYFITREPFIFFGFRVFFCPDASGQKNYRENITCETVSIPSGELRIKVLSED
jgi:hypothetical protein